MKRPWIRRKSVQVAATVACRCKAKPTTVLLRRREGISCDACDSYIFPPRYARRQIVPPAGSAAPPEELAISHRLSDQGRIPEACGNIREGGSRRDQVGQQPIEFRLDDLIALVAPCFELAPADDRRCASVAHGWVPYATFVQSCGAVGALRSKNPIGPAGKATGAHPIG